MRFSCTKENLSIALLLTSGITSKNINLPILNNILLKADQQKVEVVATNLETAVVVSMRAKTDDPGSFTVPAKTLAEFIGLLPNDKIEFETEDSELVVSCQKTTTKIKGSTAEEFPVIPVVESGDGYLVEVNDLKTGLTQILPAVAKNEIRPELAGVFFGFNIDAPNTLVLAATDSYRLAEKKMVLAQGEKERKALVPGRTAQEIVRALSALDISGEEKQARFLVAENQVSVNYANVQIISRLVDGNYPDYTQIIPKEAKTTVRVATNNLQKEIKAAGLFTTSGVNAVSLKIIPSAGHVEVSSASQQTGEYKSELAVEASGVESTILLNHRYVLDGLANISTAETVIKIINGDSPCVFSPEGDDSYLYIVMPIRQ